MSPKLIYFRQQGSMLVMALFVIIVLSLLGLAVIKIQSDGSRSIVYEVYGARAFNAATSGADRALSQLFPLDGSGSCAAVTTSLDLSSQTAFNGCDIQLECSEFFIAETLFNHYRIESTATCTAGDFVTQRSVAIEARQR